MKRLLIIILFLSSATYSQNVSPQFSELKGMEDQSGNTHLFYRIYSLTKDNNENLWIRNDIYSYDLSSGIDTLFLNDYVNSSPGSTFFLRVGDYDYWNKNVSWFIYCGWGGDFHPIPYIRRFDNDQDSYLAHNGSVNNIDISKQNDSLVFAGGWASNFGSEYERTFKSADGGFNWQLISDSLEFLSLNPFYDNIHFANFEYEFSDLDDELYITTDGGNNYSLVDTSKRQFQTSFDEFLYDVDRLHIYRVYESKYGNYLLKVSSNKGNPFTWTEKYSSTKKLFVSLDDSVSGSIYLGSGKHIYHSSDYGNNFTLYKSVDKNIVGIYKKPSNGVGSNKLYAATKYRIYEITPDTTKIIKQLPAIDDLKWYPLSIGNKWIYERYRDEFDGMKEFLGLATMEVIGDTVLNNKKSYFKLKNEPLYWDIDTALIRPDSLEGKLYIFIPVENKEFLYEDFTAEVGDTIWIDSIDYKTIFSEEYFYIWGLNTRKRTIFYPSRFQGYELVKDIGLFQWGWSGFFAIYTRELKGCIIDGVVYGDTTVVSVEYETQNVPTEFSLSQNYPNPFNPSTTIKFSVPQQTNVVLKVYDILGSDVANLVNETLYAGNYTINFNASQFASGMYIYKITAGNFVTTKKMILLK